MSLPSRFFPLSKTLSRQAGRQPRSGWTGLRRKGARWAALGCLLFTSSCNLNVFNPEQDVQMGLQAYQEILGPENVITSGQQVEMVNRIMNRLVEAARVEDPELVNLFEWEVQLIDKDEMVNAFCLPGGKMGVYTGILPVAQSETGLAVVMGHEIAHALERHGTEAVTRQMGISVVLTILAGGGEPGQLEALAGNLLGLQFGRGAELEADKSGLRYMARAGYDPREAVDFWGRMAQGSGQSPPEWLSTHPSNENRISQLQELMPGAMELYQQSQSGGDKTNPGKWRP